MDDASTGGREQDVYMQAAFAAHVVMVIMPILERAWPWAKVPLVDMPEYDL